MTQDGQYRGLTPTGITELDELFTRELKPGRIFEWGLPQGGHGRIFPLAFLRGEIPPTAWVYPEMDFEVYPPSWASQGVALDRIFFVRSNEPVKQLKPLFLENTFKVIVIDSPKKFSKGDMSFVAQKIRDNGQILFLIRNHYLSPGFGNPFAKLRVNVWRQNNGLYKLKFVKGNALKQVYLPAQRVFRV